MPYNIGGFKFGSLIDYGKISGIMTYMDELIELAKAVIGQVPSSKPKFCKVLQTADKQAVRELATRIIQKHYLLPFGGALSYMDDEQGRLEEDFIDVGWQGYGHEELEYNTHTLAEQILILFFRQKDILDARVETLRCDVEHHTGISRDELRHLEIDLYSGYGQPASVKEVSDFADNYFGSRWEILPYAIRRILNNTGCQVLDVSLTDISENCEDPCRWNELPYLIEAFEPYRAKEKAFKMFCKKYSGSKAARQLIKKLNKFSAAYLGE